MASASVLIVLIVSTMVGGIVGMVASGVIQGAPLAILSGFLGVVAAVIARNYLVAGVAKVGPDDSKIPTVVAGYSLVASVAGSLAALEITSELTLRISMVGALAGLISAVLMSMIMVTYHMSHNRI